MAGRPRPSRTEATKVDRVALLLADEHPISANYAPAREGCLSQNAGGQINECEHLSLGWVT
jgi:hypothetical protein